MKPGGVFPIGGKQATLDDLNPKLTFSISGVVWLLHPHLKVCSSTMRVRHILRQDSQPGSTPDVVMLRFSEVEEPQAKQMLLGCNLAMFHLPLERAA